MTSLIFTVNASTNEESKIMYGREMNAPYGNLCDFPRFPHSNTSKKVFIFRFARFTNIAPLWEFTSSIKIFQVHGI